MTAKTAISAALRALEAASDLNCVTHLLSEPALEAAAALDRQRPDARGILHGLPIVVKANVAVAGAPHDGGSPALKGHRAPKDAGIVARLRSAGAVPVAIANMHELAFGITSHNAYYGTVKNPVNKAHMTGGSSGGTAAAIASGAVAAGVASDTGGSGRLPAAFCGCVGLRPTNGRYPSGGVLTLSQTLDTTTVMGCDVATVARLDQAVTQDADLPAVASPRFGVLNEPLWSGVDRDMVQNGQRVLENLEARGATIAVHNVPEIEGLIEASGFPIALTETKANWERFAQDLCGVSLREFAETIASPDVKGVYLMMAAGEIPPQDAYDLAMNEKRPALETRLEQVFDEMGIDALIFPTLAKAAPLIGATQEVDINGETLPFFPSFTRRELAASIAGLPAISVPCGLDAQGLPFGMELVARAGADRDLLGLASFVEAAIAPRQTYSASG